MGLTVTLTADTADDLIRMLASLNRALGGGEHVSDKITSIDFGQLPNAGPMVAGVALAPPPPPLPTPPNEPVAVPVVNVALPPGALTPAEMRQKGSDALMQYFNRDPAGAQPHLVAVQKKFGVKKFEAIPDDRAQEFYNDAVLISNGTGAVAAS